MTASKTVYAITKSKSGHARWTRIGLGYDNKDGSTNLRVFATPADQRGATIQVRAKDETDAPHPFDARQDVFSISKDANGKAYWTRIGIGYPNRDGSLNLRLFVFPTDLGSVTIQLRPQRERKLPADSETPDPLADTADGARPAAHSGTHVF